MAARLHINQRGIAALAAPGGDVDRAVRRAAEHAQQRARTYIRQSRYRDPGVARSITVRRAGALRNQGVQYVVRARFILPDGVDLASIYEDGAKKHPIKIKSKPLVMQNRFTNNRKIVVVGKRFTKAGHPKNTTFVKHNTLLVFRDGVIHPGVKGLHYMRKALRDVQLRDFLR